MLQMVVEQPQFVWCDAFALDADEMNRLGQRFGMPPETFQDVLDPEHLPKFELFGASAFLILRYYDERAKSDADEVRELTRKIAIFVGQESVVTLHRAEAPFLIKLREKWRSKTKLNVADLVNDLIFEVLNSYETPLDAAVAYFDTLETRIFQSKTAGGAIQEMYFLKRKSTVMRKVLKMTSDLIAKEGAELLGGAGKASAKGRTQELREKCDALLFQAEGLFESVPALLNLHLSLSAHRTNEVIRVLTIFSVFFMPLTFVVGVYGMNFKFMPELEWTWGYGGVWALMIAITVGVYAWFRYRGWMK